MMDDNMRAKARATFGKAFMDAAKPQGYAKNEAVALQKRANARPIPTYKVGGAVKKAEGGDVLISKMTKDELRSGAKGIKMAEERLARRETSMPKPKKPLLSDETMRDIEREAQAERAKRGYADGGDVTAQRVAARMAAGNYKKGGKVQTSADTAKKLAEEMGGMKCGGKPGKYAQGGAGKVRKGMMSPSGDIKQVVKPKKGIGGVM